MRKLHQEISIEHGIVVVINLTMWFVGLQNWFIGEMRTSLKIPRLAKQNLLGLLMGVWERRTPVQIVDGKGQAHEREKKIPSGQEVVYVVFWQETWPCSALVLKI